MSYRMKKPLRLDCNSCETKKCCAKCEGVFLNEKEVHWLKLKKPKLQIEYRENKFKQRKPFMVFPNKRCPFLSDRGTCSIYANRPNVCYWYPVDFREMTYGKAKVTLLEDCEWVHKNIDKILEITGSLEAPEDPTLEPDKRKFRLKVCIICEIFGYPYEISRGNPEAKALVKIWR